MNLKTLSNVLIVGVNPVSISLACVLAKSSVKVLVVDDLAVPETAENELDISAYSKMMLENAGDFKIKHEINSQDFINQGLNILAHYLCSVYWEAEIVDSSDDNYQIIYNAQKKNYQAQFIFQKNNLLLSSDFDINIKNVLLMGWRIIGVSNNTLSKLSLTGYEQEKKLLLESTESPKTFWNKWLAKYTQPKNPIESPFINSSINLHLSQKRLLQAGELLPNLPFYDEKLKQDSSLYQWCNYQYFSLMIIGKVNATYLHSVAKWIQLNYSIQLYYLPYSDNNASVFESLHLSKEQIRTLIIRPDRYIAFLHDSVDTEIIDNYLRLVLLMKAKAE